jgi:peptidoglycan hydrolase-like protein with peptidoglycan-binding domain
MTMRTSIRNLALATASAAALSIGGIAPNFAAEAGGAINAACPSAASKALDRPLTDESFRKDDIRWAQVELRDRGLYRGSLDGIIGPQTKHALGEFQKNSGLTRTASLDAQTWDALTGDSGVAQGSSMPPNSDGAGSMKNSSAASDLGR